MNRLQALISLAATGVGFYGCLSQNTTIVGGSLAVILLMVITASKSLRGKQK